MTHTYIAYKREDELRVARLASALERAGVDIWWDRELPGGESWHQNLEVKLATAGCVLVVWTHASTGPDNRYVRDEAGQGLARNILVPVTLDRVKIPLGFGDIQAIDLTHWKGDPKDPSFKDLVAAVEAKLAGQPVPTPVGMTARVRRRLLYSAFSTAGVAAIASFSFNTFGVASKVCTMPGLQPGLSDSCGSIGIGNRPSHKERIAWEGLPKGNCEALRTFVQTYPHGAHSTEATALITSRRVVTEERWTPVTRALVLFAPSDGSAAASRLTAQTQALARAQISADQLCRGFGSGTLYRFVSATPKADSWKCEGAGAGQVCGFEGSAQCQLLLRDPVETEKCGTDR